MKNLLSTAAFLALAIPALAQPQYLGTLSANRFDRDSVSNPYGPYGSPYSPTSINNPYGTYGSRYSPLSVNDPYTMNAPRLYSSTGSYLGKLSANPYDPDSVSNPYSSFGSPYSPTSANNPYSVYGSPYSPMSPKNRFGTQAPRIVGGYGRY